MTGEEEKEYSEHWMRSKSDGRCRPEEFCKKGILRNFPNSQENTCARVSLLASKRCILVVSKQQEVIFGIF